MNGLIQSEKPTSKSRRQPTSSRTKRGKAGETRKVALVLPSDVDKRLTAIAADEQMDRSALAAKLIDQGLGKFKLDGLLRTYFNVPASEDRQAEAVA